MIPYFGPTADCLGWRNPRTSAIRANLLGSDTAASWVAAKSTQAKGVDVAPKATPLIHPQLQSVGQPSFTKRCQFGAEVE
jgi:hypothetical protein